jgi:hypothetical protein
MNAVQLVIEDMNLWPKLTGNTEEMIQYPPALEDFAKIRSHIECSLSPENLHCDGEASPEHVRYTYAKLTKAWDMLAQLDGNHAEPYV